MFGSLSPQRRRLALGLVILAAVALVAGIVVAVVRSRPSVTPVAQDRLGPVLLVAGYGGRIASLDPLVAALQADGRTVQVVQPVGDNTDDLRLEAKHLGAVAAAAKAAGAPSVDVIGYSAGGVIVRLWVRYEGGGDLARRVLTLGSPQHGTSQAALGQELAGGCSTACEQLVPASDLLRQLNAGDETPAGPLWATVRSTSDTVVTPTDSASLSGALNILVQDVCPGATTPHGDLPGSPVVRAALTSVFGVAPPSVPANVAC